MKKFLTLLFLILVLAYPSLASIIVSNGLTKIHEVPFKGYREGTIVLKNTSSKNESFRCYLNDLATNCAGEVFYQDPGVNANSLSPYLSTTVTEATLAPGEEYELVYKVDLAKSNFQTGSLWSLLMIEVVKPIAETQTNAGFSVDSKIRYGIQIITNVGSQEEPIIQFSNVQLGSDGEGKKMLEASLSNSGAFLSLPLVEIQVYNSKGEKVKDLSVPSKKIYPQNCQKFQLPIDDLPEGKYKAVLFAEYLESTIGLNIELEL